MSHPKSASHIAIFVIGFASFVSLADCTGLTGHPAGPGTGNAGAAGSAAGRGGTGGATTGAGGVAGGLAGAGNTGAVGGSVGAAGTGVAGNIGTAGSVAGSGESGTGGLGGGGMWVGGRGGGGASGGTSGTGGSAPTRGPTPAANGVNFPFPHNRESSRCVYPTGYLNSHVVDAYNQWKADTVTSNGAGGARRVQRLASDPVSMYTPAGSTVSEGISYGMMMAVFMNDRPLFDDLWNYSQKHLNGNGLMNWSITADGMGTPGLGGATDADEDIAFSLVMADRQWGSTGPLNYLNLAKSQINNVWNHEIVDSKLAGPGDSWGPTNLWNNINISYFAPAFYRIFKQVDPGHDWDAVVKTTYDTIMSALNSSNGNLNNGLVPAWCTSTGGMSSTTPFHYQYDSCRTPFRIALDWCWFGEQRARDYLAKTSTFFSGVGAANIVDGYDLNGNKHVQFSPATATPTLAQQSAAFIGPAGVGAMSSSSYQTFVNDSYARVATRQLLVGGAYYDESWTVLSLLMMTGNYYDMTAYQPLTQ
jgi:endo-1,4-beta-D-glucanase Y